MTLPDVHPDGDATGASAPAPDGPPAEALPAAVLWDMDGTLVDTEPYWMRAEQELVQSFGGRWTDADGLALVGMGLWDAALVFQAHGVALTTDEIVERLTDRVLEQVRVEVPWRPGARELLAGIRNAGIPTALVTMSVTRMADAVVDAIGFTAFDRVVGGDQVDRPKPAPDPYLRAAELLGVDIRRCIAIEDSIPGVASAVAAGAVTIGVPLHSPLGEDPSHTLWGDLDGRTVADLVRVLRDRADDRAAAR